MLAARDSAAPGSNGSAIPSFGTPPTLAELDQFKPKQGTVLQAAVQRARRERRDPRRTTGGFDNRM